MAQKVLFLSDLIKRQKEETQKKHNLFIDEKLTMNQLKRMNMKLLLKKLRTYSNK